MLIPDIPLPEKSQKECGLRNARENARENSSEIARVMELNQYLCVFDWPKR